jgi:hypothetical protein
VAYRDAEDWQHLRDALYGEVGKVDADRAIERLRHARQDLPASTAEATPRFWLEESDEHAVISIEGVPRIVVRHGFSAAVYALIDELVAERIRRAENK